MRDPRLDELIQMETWDWWKAQVFYCAKRKITLTRKHCSWNSKFLRLTPMIDAAV